MCPVYDSSDEAPGCAQVTGQSQPQNLRQPSSASPCYNESQSMAQNHREAKSLSNPLQENLLQQAPLQDHPFQENLLQENPLQEISSLLEVCGEALDQAGGCWCQPSPGQLHPAELLCEVSSSSRSRSSTRTRTTLRFGSHLPSDSCSDNQMKANLETVMPGKTGDHLSVLDQARLYMEP